MKLIHISDLHINSAIADSNIEKTIFLLKSAIKTGVDHILISGDITDNGTEKDFDIFRKILKNLNLLSGERVSLVAGNHDIYGGVTTTEDLISFPSRCLNTEYGKKVELFHSYFSETLDNAFFLPDEGIYPYAKNIDGVLIVGLNSNEKFSLKNPAASNGKINKPQLEKLSFILDNFTGEYHTKILLVHHHFYKLDDVKETLTKKFLQKIESQTTKLKKRRKLIKLFTNLGVNLVLHGHIHENRSYNVKGIKFINSGASIQNLLSERLSLSSIHIHNGKISDELLKFQFVPSKKDYLHPDYFLDIYNKKQDLEYLPAI